MEFEWLDDDYTNIIDLFFWYVFFFITDRLQLNKNKKLELDGTIPEFSIQKFQNKFLPHLALTS